MKVNIFDTLEEAEQAQAYDLKKYLEKNGDGNVYDTITTRWCRPMERCDGRFTTDICRDSDGNYSIVEYFISDYPIDEDENNA